MYTYNVFMIIKTRISILTNDKSIHFCGVIRANRFVVNNNYNTALHFYSLYLTNMGQIEKAIVGRKLDHMCCMNGHPRDVSYILRKRLPYHRDSRARVSFRIEPE